MSNIFRKGLFDGHVAIVTGGGSGIGLATADALGELGAKVAICGRKKEKLEAAETGAPRARHRASSPARATSARPSRSARSSMRVKAEARHRRRSSSTTPAASSRRPPRRVSPRGWEAVVRNNLNGTFFMTQAVATQAHDPRASAGAS